ncbi:Serine protease, subtilisin family [Actinacidiphila alni]|uniref:Serine protease, subtilisin family n=1 Tax=Actinacidiphila alni TaxID=380248 RepID=A0A1I2IYJ5_9ACTN|nr:S8 family serine peptidase [Actinacidiphila alni]SFF47249.1 Serine protease, subtilisin family [Actinacidiphila alni]
MTTRSRLTAALSAGLALTLAAAATAAADPHGAAAAPATPAASTADDTATVRLITGDEVTLRTAVAGRQTVAVTPAAGRRGITFRTYEENGRLTVLPSDAAGLVNAGRLDRQLFDVTGLVAQRYDLAHSAALPLIVASATAGAAGASAAVRTAGTAAVTALTAGTVPVRDLESIGARSVRVTADQADGFWKRLTAGGSGTARSASLPKVWLDARVGAVSDTGVDQIGAPVAWEAGYRGQGVKVAVLDTGVDRTHPDLAGRVALAEDFTSSPSGTADLFGHGTHVASIVGGNGAASHGVRQGVAPASSLLIGKVLGDDGYGTESGVIDGMEWAADSGARVVNMSLGSDEPSDGTDPVSLALNGISRTRGTLFVVAAGNNGSGPQTVGTPGVADRALTVGAVDRQDALAPFSSRGPRIGDGAVKPDVTAPGVGIVAARAAGTTLGDPVDRYYTAASGTSMATPHVAGAAALLAQQHPDWGADRLKDALVSTAYTAAGQLPTEQGGGRIDLAAAIPGPVTATGTVALGNFPAAAHAVTRTTTVRYVNTSGRAVSLGLSMELATAGGRKAAAGAVRLGSAEVTVPAGGSAEVPVTVDPGRTPAGSYYGYLTARSADGSVRVHTTASLVVHAPTHRLTVVGYDSHGARVTVRPTIWGPNGFVQYSDPAPDPAEDAGAASGSGPAPTTVDVEEGTYEVQYEFDDDATTGVDARVVVLPQVKVTKDMTVTLDARRTTRVEIRTPRPAEQRGGVSYQTYREIDGRSMNQGVAFFDGGLHELYVSPTEQVTEGEFEFSSRWQMFAPDLTAVAPGTGLDLAPYYLPRSPLLDSRGPTLTAVDAGSVEEPDLRRVRGKLAVVRNDSGLGEQELAQQAADAGARAVLMLGYSDNSWSQWNPTGERDALPVVRVARSAGTALLKRLASRATTVRFGGTMRSPYLYDVTQVSSQRIPRQVVHTVTTRNSAVVHSTYADNGGVPWASEQRFSWRPYQGAAMELNRYVPTGLVRTEYVSADGTLWQHVVSHLAMNLEDEPLLSGMRDVPREYRPGQRADDAWQAAVVRPSIPRSAPAPTVRTGDVMALRIPEFADSGAGHWSPALRAFDGGIGTRTDEPVADVVSAVLRRDGAVVGSADTAWTDIEVPSGTADYRLDLTTARNSAEWTTATATRTSWSFRSGTTDEATALPLLQLDYAVPVDVDNSVRAGRAHIVGLTVRAPDGVPTPTGVRLRAETSDDDGATWHRAAVTAHGHNAFDAVVLNGGRAHGSSYVTLRVTAWDAAGHRVQQTVDRAYRLRG